MDRTFSADLAALAVRFIPLAGSIGASESGVDFRVFSQNGIAFSPIVAL